MRFFILYFFLIVSIFGDSLTLKKIKIEDYPIEYYYDGKKTPIFLLVHGLGVSKNSFYNFAYVLAKEYHYQILLPDIPGQGDTLKINEKNYSIENMANFLYQFLKALKINKVILVGNSMGGHIASVFAIKYPKLVSYLVLISPAGIENEKEKPYPPIPLENVQDIKLKKSLEWNNKIREDIRSGEFYIMNSYLNKIQHKTILFWGTKDEIISYSNSSIWASEIPDARLYVLKGGHLLQNEKPKEMIRIILKEIAKH